MNIKSLLIGSAAATVAATGAQAADPIFVPEPEPMEYVRVCDVYGAGFFYIPGTETCLKIGGYVRYEIGAGSDVDFADDVNDFGEIIEDDDVTGAADSDSDGWSKLARATVTLDARSETEYGTLGGFIELRGDVTNGSPDEVGPLNDGGYLSSGIDDDEVGVQQAIISLGGLSMGVSDTLYDAALSGEFDSGGGSRAHFIRYTFDFANGAYLAVALEEADSGYDYTPNVVGNLGFAQGWGSVNLWGAYDATAEEWAAKAIGKFNLTQSVVLEAMATYESDQSFYSVDNNVPVTIGARTFNTGYEWSAGGYLKFAATPKMSLGFGGQYFSDNHVYFDNDDYAIGGVLDYEIVENFNSKLAVNYFNGDSYADGAWGGFLRFDRNF